MGHPTRCDRHHTTRRFPNRGPQRARCQIGVNTASPMRHGAGHSKEGYSTVQCSAVQYDTVQHNTDTLYRKSARVQNRSLARSLIHSSSSHRRHCTRGPRNYTAASGVWMSIGGRAGRGGCRTVCAKCEAARYARPLASHPELICTGADQHRHTPPQKRKPAVTSNVRCYWDGIALCHFILQIIYSTRNPTECSKYLVESTISSKRNKPLLKLCHDFGAKSEPKKIQRRMTVVL